MTEFCENFKEVLLMSCVHYELNYTSFFPEVSKKMFINPTTISFENKRGK